MTGWRQVLVAATGAAVLVCGGDVVRGQEATGTVRGVVVVEDVVVAGVEVEVGGRRGASGSDGRFQVVGVPAGRHQLRALSGAHPPFVVAVRVVADSVTEVEVRLEPMRLEPVAVTGTMQRTYVSDSPVKVEVVTSRELERTVASSLAEAVRHVNGLLPQVDCGVCYTNSIRINGMEGPYTAVLIDGMPIAGGLGSVYGLSGIDPGLIEQLEIIRGPSSTLYGSEAMGGVVNVVTKDPRYAPRATVHASRADHGQTELDVSFAPRVGSTRVLLSGSLYRMGRFLDENADGFTDVTMDTRLAVFGRIAAAGAGTTSSLTLKLYGEDRYGGEADWAPPDGAAPFVYGESIETRRAEVMGVFVPPAVRGLRLEGSYAWHEQDSYYGLSRYRATQHTGVANLLLQRNAGVHDVLAGVTLRYRHYDDETPATVEAEQVVVPGVLVQDEMALGDAVVAVGGLRLDHHARHGPIVSPRLSLKWEPLSHTVVRLNAGTGFRVVSVFTEDHAALTGAREVVFAEQLEPERSRSVALNLNQVVEIGPSPMTIDVDLFHTRFSNRIVADYDVDPDAIVYANLDGHAVTRGLSLAVNQNIAFERVLYQLGLTVQDVYLVRDGERTRELYAPSWRGVFGMTWNVLPALSLDWSGAITGPMRLPQYPAPHERAVRSPTYSVHDVRVTWRGGDGLAVYGAVVNLFDYRQGTPLVAASDPFGDAFDTTYVWGPIEGRRLVVGARWGLSR